MAVQYSVPAESQKLFQNGILENPLIRDDLPSGAVEAARSISFEGSNMPSLPINWRFAESISAIKAYEATVLNVLLQKKYGIGPVPITINTDHAQLFIMSGMIWVIDPEGAGITAASSLDPKNRVHLTNLFPEWDKHRSMEVPYRVAATNIYKTTDDKYFHLHGSLNPDPTLHFLGLPSDVTPTPTADDAIRLVQAAASKHTASELQTLADDNRQAGTICFTPEEYRSSAHGFANAHAGLFTITHHPFGPSPAAGTGAYTWWPSTARTSPARPLAGLKVVDLTRIIAGPTISRGLAELGASVMRITAPHLPDLSALHPDLNHGKWNAFLDLRLEADRAKLRALVRDADVFVQGYRPGVLEKFGFGEADVLAIGREGGRGIVYCAENCYGWDGPWSGRSGWQQISDACTGVSYEFGRAMGNDEPVTPVFPNSDYSTGAAGTVGVLTALLRRAENGGSYVVKTALNYYSQWLVNSCGVYPPEVWQALHAKFKFNFRHSHYMTYTLPRVVGALFQDPETAGMLFKPEFFTQYHVGSIGKPMRIVAPVLRFPRGEVKLGYDVGTRTNGVDQPRWPDDLDTEVVQ